jgi:hypothetical protein
MSVQQMAAIIQNAAEFTPYWTDDPATHQDPYENAAKALLSAGYGPVEKYEYAVQYDSWGGHAILGQYWESLKGEYWGEREERQRVCGWNSKEFPKTSFWVVKRRKAGKVELVD